MVAEFEKAVNRLSESVLLYKKQTDLKMQQAMRDSVIQRFGFTFELAWKTAIKLLGIVETAPKPALREMARSGLIADFQMWFNFLEARNKSSHTYNEDVALAVFKSACEFLEPSQKLLETLKSK